MLYEEKLCSPVHRDLTKHTKHPDAQKHCNSQDKINKNIQKHLSLEREKPLQILTFCVFLQIKVDYTKFDVLRMSLRK